MITVNMARAREIQRDCIRSARVPLLAALDVAWMRAGEVGDAARQAEVAAQKQALRDAPAGPRIEAAEAPEALAAVWPLPAA
jgi:hypothetical protein